MIINSFCSKKEVFTLFKFCRILPVLALCFLCYLASKASAEKIPQTYGDAMRWYEKAAKGGNTKAQFLLAYMHETGKGRPYNPSLAVIWYILAAEKNHTRAQFRLGMLYSRDSSKTTDLKKAIEETTGQNLDWFFKQWIYEPGFPEYDVNWKYNQRSWSNGCLLWIQKENWQIPRRIC